VTEKNSRFLGQKQTATLVSYLIYKAKGLLKYIFQKRGESDEKISFTIFILH